ncbi:hypothetical protein ACH4A8_29310 [Streptomyces vietnamensis]|uniref:hypothetical protein n=1 Tax=Streptomyces vietnamensis TaxID=362257 RepID=UPI0037A50E09
MVLGSVVALSGCAFGGGTGAASRSPEPVQAPLAVSLPELPATTVEHAPAPSVLPGVGPAMLADIPAGSRQVLLVTGDGADASTSTVRLYERTEAGWRPAGASWPAHNGFKGWTDDHRLGDLRSPVGVYGLTAAGGLLPDPGTRLPYDHSGGFSINGTGFEGEPLAGSFDYVVAIDYNREPGTSPRNWTRPLGRAKGGGVWVHVDHGGPTHACVSIAKKHMKELLRALDPAKAPVIVMGDAASLSR